MRRFSAAQESSIWYGWVAGAVPSTKSPSPSSPGMPPLYVHLTDCGQITHTAWRLPSMPDHSPAHSCALEHTMVACVHVWLWLQPAMRHIHVSPYSSGHTPLGCFAVSSCRHALKPLYIADAGDWLLMSSVQRATSSLNFQNKSHDIAASCVALSPLLRMVQHLP